MSVSQINVSEKQLSYFCQLTQQNQEVVNSIRDKDVVILMGATGSGKSTTTNVLCGCRPVVEKIETPQGHKKTVINTYSENSFKPMEIGHTEVSQTLIAGAARDPHSGVMYVDAMGHKDNRGWEVALANAANLMSIVKCCRSLKLMILIPAASVHTNRGESIVEMLLVLEYLLKNAGGLNAFSQSLLVLVTKAKDMEDVNNLRSIVHNVNTSLEVVGLSFEDENKAKFQEAQDDSEFHPGTVEELKQILANNIQAVSLNNVDLQAPITDTDRQVLNKLQNILKNKVQKVGIEDIEKAITMYNAFCFLQVIQCPEVDMMIIQMQEEFLTQFQQQANIISQHLNKRNLQGALQIKNKLEQALQSIQKHSPKLSEFIKKNQVLEMCDHLIKQVQKFEEELKAEKIAREKALKEKQAAEQAKREAEKQRQAAEQQRQVAEQMAAVERENNRKAQEVARQQQEQRVAEEKKHAAALVAIAERQRQEAEQRAEEQRKELLARQEEQRRMMAEQQERDHQRNVQMAQLQERVARAESRSSGGICAIM